MFKVNETLTNLFMYRKRIWSIKFLQGYLKTTMEIAQHTYIKKKIVCIIKTYGITWTGDWTFHSQVQILILATGITHKFGKPKIWLPPQVIFLAAVALYVDSTKEIHKGSGGKDMNNEDKTDDLALEGSNKKNCRYRD